MNDRALNELARLLRRADRGSQIAQELSGKMEPTFGTIVDVADPDRRGRVKVILDQVNPDFLTQDEFNQGESQATQSDWIKPDVPFRGVQPEKLVGMRVPVKARNGDPNRLSFGAPIHDPEEYQEQGGANGAGQRAARSNGGGESEDGEIPDNSDMVRCQVFPSGSLPDASQENHGCMVIEEGGPMESDWLCVCMKRKGEFYWVRHIDLSHGHAGQDDSDPSAEKEIEPPDERGRVKQYAVWDFVFPTTDKEYPKKPKETIYGTDPRWPDDPYVDDAKWHGGA